MNYVLQKEEDPAQCLVCSLPLNNIAQPVSYKTADAVVILCSNECLKEYMENPELYGAFADEEEDEAA